MGGCIRSIGKRDFLGIALTARALTNYAKVASSHGVDTTERDSRSQCQAPADRDESAVASLVRESLLRCHPQHILLRIKITVFLKSREDVLVDRCRYIVCVVTPAADARHRPINSNC